MALQKKVYLVDTNVILRFLLGDHKEFSPKAGAFMAAVSKGVKKAEVPEVVVVECVYVLEKYYKIPKQEIVDKLMRLLNFSGIVNADRSEIMKALIAYEHSNSDIVDCILAARSSSEKVVVSFDKDFERLKAVRELL